MRRGEVGESEREERWWERQTEQVIDRLIVEHGYGSKKVKT